MVRHHSGRDLWLSCVLGISGLVMLGAAMAVRTPFMILTAAAYVGILGWIWFGTYYVIDGSELVVRCGPFRQTRDLDSIRQVRETRSPLSSPALSMNRLVVDCGDRGFVIISPADRAAFLRDLKQAAPGVIIMVE